MISSTIFHENDTLNVPDPPEMLFNRNKFMIGALLEKEIKKLSYRWIWNEPGMEVIGKHFHATWIISVVLRPLSTLPVIALIKNLCHILWMCLICKLKHGKNGRKETFLVV